MRWLGANSIKTVGLTDEQRDFMENGVIPIDPEHMRETEAIEPEKLTAGFTTPTDNRDTAA